MRTLALPKEIEHWSLTTLREKLVKIGAVGRYQADGAFVQRSWAEANAEALVGYLKAGIEGIRWAYDPTNRSEAAAILEKRLNIDPPSRSGRSRPRSARGAEWRRTPGSIGKASRTCSGYMIKSRGHGAAEFPRPKNTSTFPTMIEPWQSYRNSKWFPAAIRHPGRARGSSRPAGT